MKLTACLKASEFVAQKALRWNLNIEVHQIYLSPLQTTFEESDFELFIQRYRGSLGHFLISEDVEARIHKALQIYQDELDYFVERTSAASVHAESALMHLISTAQARPIPKGLELFSVSQPLLSRLNSSSLVNEGTQRLVDWSE